MTAIVKKRKNAPKQLDLCNTKNRAENNWKIGFI
jgi:hypothetical protein